MAKTAAGPNTEYCYRVRFVRDPRARFEECNGQERPLSAEEYAENAYMKDGHEIPYAEYLQYYGNPNRHVYLACIVEKQSIAGGKWGDPASLWGIDFMDDSPEVRAVELSRLDRADATYTPEQAIALPGYLSYVSKEVLEEAGYTLPWHVYCAQNGCTAWHIDGGRYCDPHAKQAVRRSVD